MKQLEIVIATGNKNKVKEYEDLFKDYSNVKLLSLKDVNITLDVDENGKTYLDNALIKAKAIAKLTDKLIIADDSGIGIEALDGFPGVHSARFLKEFDYVKKCNIVIELLKPYSNLKAHFYCSIVLANFENKNEFHSFSHTVDGTVIDKLKGNNGFGYDPIFKEDITGLTYAQMSDEQKEIYSHRGIACRKLIEFLENKGRLKKKN